MATSSSIKTTPPELLILEFSAAISGDSKFPGWPAARDEAIDLKPLCKPDTRNVFNTLFGNPREIPKIAAKLAPEPNVVDSPTDGFTILCPKAIKTAEEFLVPIYEVLDALKCPHELVPSEFGNRMQVIATCDEDGDRLEFVLRMYTTKSGLLVLGYHCQRGTPESSYRLYNTLEHYIKHGPDTNIPVTTCGLF
jgi:hypothetical protein